MEPLDENERKLIESLRADRLLKKAVYNYFSAESGVKLEWWR